MNAIKDVFTIIGYIVAFIAMVAGVIIFAGVVLWFAAVIVALFVLLWAGGLRWKIYREKQLIGYVRWFTFYPVRQRNTEMMQ